jgi:flagellar biosynthesis/type III secretory pathway M-ring protein FliF/YscJ
MPDPQTDALIDQLRRTARFWKSLALGTVAVLVLAVAGLTAFAAVRAARSRAAEEAARIEAEKARRKAEQALRDGQAAEDRARHRAEQVERALYARSILQAQQAWAEGRLESPEP